MAQPKYIDLIVESLRDVRTGLSECREEIRSSGSEISNLKASVTSLKDSFDEKMPAMQNQLDEHTKHSNLAHEKIDTHVLDFKYLQDKVRDIEEREKEISKKLDSIAEHIEDHKKELEMRRRFEKEQKLAEEAQQAKRDKFMKNFKYSLYILGSPLAIYGVFEGLSKLIEMFATGGTP